MPVAQTKVEPEVAEVPGLEDYVALGQLIDALTILRGAKLEEIAPALSMFWVEEAAKNDEFPKTFVGVDGHATASVTLKRRSYGKNGLPREDVERLGTHGIPLRSTGAGLTVNKDYLDDQRVLTRLARLIAANPDADIPTDFLGRMGARSLPDEDAMLRVLRLPPAQAVDLLDAVASIVVSRATLDGKATLRQFVDKAEEMLATLPEDRQAA